MKRITFLLAVAILAGVVAYIGHTYGQANGGCADLCNKNPPDTGTGGRISVSARSGPNLGSIGAVLGNDVAIKAYPRSFPYVDILIIAASALRSRPVGGKQQGLWPSPIFRRPAPEHSVYGQDSRSTLRQAAGGSLPS